MKKPGQVTVDLKYHLRVFVRDQMRAGGFASESEYVLHLIQEQYEEEQDTLEKLDRLDEALMRSLSDAKSGRVFPMDKAIRKLRKEILIAG